MKQTIQKIISIVLISLLFFQLTHPVLAEAVQQKQREQAKRLALMPNEQSNSADVLITSTGYRPSTVTIKTGGTVTWVNTDNKPHEITSQQVAPISKTQIVPLELGWNLTSFNIEPESRKVVDVMSGLAPHYKRVLGEEHSYDPALLDSFNSLKEMAPSKGYYIYITNTSTISWELKGQRLPVTTPLALKKGWNWIGYLPQTAMPITEALKSIEGNYRKVIGLKASYDVSASGFKQLEQMEPHQGYLIYIENAATLVYPKAVTTREYQSPIAAQTPTRACDTVSPTPYLTLVYGELMVNGKPAPVGTQVEVMTPSDSVAGCFVVSQAGQFGLMHVYGEENVTTSSQMPTLFREGERLTFRIDGQQVESDLMWHNDRQSHRVKVDVSLEKVATQVYLPLLTKEGPANPQEIVPTEFTAQQNRQTVTHTVKVAGLGESWGSGVLPPNGKFKIKFSQPGTYTYTDSFYPQMQGVVIVKPELMCTVETPTLTNIPAPSSDNVGYTPGGFQVNQSGSSTYQISLQVPPGTADMVPSNLSLLYDSKSGNGPMGLGWSVAGLSSINRCGTTLAQQGFIDRVDFDDNDQYCLNGQLLVAVNGVYGGHGTSYRTENESFAKIISYNSQLRNPRNGGRAKRNATSPLSFKVWTKDGLIQEYGNTADSRIEAPGRDDVMSWAINKISDRAENYISYSYNENSTTGEYYPSRIDYTGNTKAGLAPYNSIQFSYEERPDISTGYMPPGIALTNTQRLRAIRSYAEGTLAREYKLAYLPISNTQTVERSRLASVTECNGAGECFKPTTFEWLSSTPGFEKPKRIFKSVRQGANLHPVSTSGWHEALVDLNGDGKADRAWIPWKRSELWVALANDTGFDDPKMWLDPAASGAGVVLYSYKGKYETYIDMNGDGLADRAWFPDRTSNLWVALSTGQGFAKPKIWLDATSNGAGVVPYSNDGKHQTYADLNGDGLVDRAWIPNRTSNLWVALSTGQGFEKPKIWLNRTSNGTGVLPHSNGHHEQYADLNGDGLVDRTWIPHRTGDLWVALSTGQGFEKPKVWLDTTSNGVGVVPYSNGQHERYADLNGDGLADRVWIPHRTGDLWVALSTGQGFAKPKIWLSSTSNGAKIVPSSTHGRHEIYADMNGDGLVDRAWFPYNTANLWVALSTGQGFEKPKIWLNTTSNGAGTLPYSIDGKHETYTDVNGDGTVDRVWSPHRTGGLWVALGTATSNRVISKITNGHGYTTEIDYKPLTDQRIYTKGSQATYPQLDVQNSMQVVSAYRTSNGLGGTSEAIYHYTGLQANLRGRGMSGFRKIVVTDKQTGIKNSTYYRQQHPFQSLVEKEEYHTKNNILISRNRNQWAVLRYDKANAKVNVDSTSAELTNWVAPNEAGITYFPFVKQDTSESWDLNGSFVMSQTTVNQYDGYGNLESVATTYSDGHEKMVVNDYKHDINSHRFNGLDRARSNVTAPGQGVQHRTAGFGYDLGTGFLSQETEQPSTSSSVNKNYRYDGFGNIVQSNVQEQRPQYSSYDAKGRFLVISRNALGHTEKWRYDARFGKPTQLTDPNGLVTRWDYDEFGRPVRETRPDNTQTVQFFKWCDSNCPPLAVYYRQTEQSGQGATREYLNLLDQVIRQERIGFDGQKIYTDIEYNERGQIKRQSDPYLVGQTPQWTTFAYNELGKPVGEMTPDGSAVRTRYNGLSVTVQNSLGQSIQQKADTQTNITNSIDHNSKEMVLTYDGFGSLLELKDSQGHTTKFEHDERGRKTTMVDPDMGKINYQYNLFDELIKQTDSKGQTISFSYDVLGRLAGRNEPDGGNTIWEYDSQPKGQGKLSKVSRFDGYQETYTYDTLGRVNKITFSFDGHSFQISTTYDDFSRVKTVTYPNGVRVENHYNQYGYLAEVCDADTGALYWRVNKVNVREQIEEQIYGNGVTSIQNYDFQTGRLSGIKTNSKSGNVIQDLSYQFDVVGNLLKRTDNRLSRNEQFSYDSLNRLTMAKVTGQPARTTQYSEIGNIIYRSDVGTYNYSGAGPHAVTSITKNGATVNRYQYDVNGNRISSLNGTVQYSVFNKPILLTEGNARIELSYNPDREQYKKVVSNVNGKTTTYSIRGIYELREKDGVTEQVNYIYGLQGVVAILSKQAVGSANETTSTRYLHRDHIDSVDTVTDEVGQVVERYSFDAWGKRRDPNTWADLPAMPEFLTARGFTGHEHLDGVNLIHMNGRVYDPVIGRFLSADPFVQAPTDMQSLNRYSYVQNNPLSYKDSSGFGFFKKVWKKVKSFVKKYWKPILAIVITVATAGVVGWIAGTVFGACGIIAGLIGGTAAKILGAVVTGAISGFVNGFANTLLNGGSLPQALKAGLIQGAIGGITGGLDAIKALNLFHPLVRDIISVVGKGVVGGLESVQQGGRFAHGFFKGALQEALGILDVAVEKVKLPPVGEAIAKAVVAGTASELGGGKFVNGAVTSAFASLFGDSSKIKVGSVVKKLAEWSGALNERYGSRLTKGLHDLVTNADYLINMAKKPGDYLKWSIKNPGMAITLGTTAVVGYVGYSLLKKEIKIPRIPIRLNKYTKVGIGGSYKLGGRFDPDFKFSLQTF